MLKHFIIYFYFQGDMVDQEDCWPDKEIRATSVTVTIQTYNDSTLEGAFDITLENGDSLTGTFDVYF